MRTCRNCIGSADFGCCRSWDCSRVPNSTDRWDKNDWDPEVGDTHIHDTTIDVSKFLEAKQPRAMSRVIESEALDRSAQAVRNAPPSLTHGGGIDWHSSGVGRRIGFLTVGGVSLVWKLHMRLPTQHEAAEYRNWTAL